MSAAAVSTLIAATAHTLSGGLAPLWLMVAAALLASPLAVWLVGRTPSLVRTAAVVATSQGLFHVFFAVAGGSDPAAASAHTHGTTALDLEASTAIHLHAPSATMIGGHLVAALVTTILLVHGERMLSALGRGIRRLFSRSGVTPLPRRPRTLAPAPTAFRPHARVVLSSLSRRGPPVTA